MKKFLFAISAVLLALSCTTPRRAASLSTSPDYTLGGKVWSSVFQQRAAEYEALCLQAFNLARLRLDEALAQPGSRRLAIVTDIDETILDNSPYAVRLALQGKDYDLNSWQEWTALGIADTLPGALGLLHYAASRKVEVFYITNRYEKERKGTLENLQRFGFPFADDAHLMLRTTSSGKEDRRKRVAEDYEIVLLLGDNLSDFSALFDKRGMQERDATVKAMAAEFGRKFIMLPNFNYGGWEEALFQFKYDWSPAQKDSILQAELKGY